MLSNSWEWQIDHNTFDQINVDCFLNYRFGTLVSYLVLWGGLILKLLFVGSDVYTLIKLIVFNTWSSDVQPFISYSICKWLFFGCILLSIVFYAYLLFKLIVLYLTNNVSLTYINTGAMFMKSVRSYKYFCVYNEISSDNFFNYLAIFTFFTLQNCQVLLLCDTPRQVINGITLFKILKFNSSMITVIKEIASTNRTEAVILSVMTFSFIIWFIFFVKFLFACLLYLPLLHRIKYEYGFKKGLKQYCCIKINQCIQKFMKVKHTKSLAQVREENKQDNVYPRLPKVDDEEKQGEDPFAGPPLHNPFNDSQSTVTQPYSTVLFHKRPVDRQNSDITFTTNSTTNLMAPAATLNPFASENQLPYSYTRTYLPRPQGSVSSFAIREDSMGSRKASDSSSVLRLPPACMVTLKSDGPAGLPNDVVKGDDIVTENDYSSEEELALDIPDMEFDFETPTQQDTSIDNLQRHRDHSDLLRELGIPPRS